MYGKIFAKMYEGTLYGQWEALVTFQQMIVLCDADGMIDMTPQAIASRTSIPLEIIEKGIRILEAPDQYSRTPDEEGRRIERIDAHRPWGWHLVNHAKYTAMQDADTVRHQTRERVRKHREKQREEQALAEDVTLGNGQKRHTDTNTDTDTDTKGKALSGGAPDVVRTAAMIRKDAREIATRVLTYLNEKASTKYRWSEPHLRLMAARVLQDQANEAEMRAVVDAKVKEWAADPEKRRYLSPDTLFNATKYAKYAGQLAIGAAPAQKLEVKAYAERADGSRELVITYQANGLQAEAAARQILAQHQRRFEEARAKNIVLDNGRNSATFSLSELGA